VGQIRYEVSDRIALVTIEGDNDLNVLTLDMMDALVDRLLAFQDDRDVAVAILTGAGERAFSVGGDLRGPGDDPDFFSAERVRAWCLWPREGRRSTFTRIMTLEVDKPVIAAVNGYCLGGALVAMVQLSDIRVAGTGATFGLAETKHGMPGGAATAQLGKYLPHAVAMQMALTGNSITAADAYRWGLVSKLVEPGEVLATARALALEVAALPVEVAKAEKEGALQALHLSREGAFRVAQYQYTVFAHESGAQEGVASFRQHKHGAT
jgi:E-phenylitaconyl-CoA hydratase